MLALCSSVHACHAFSVRPGVGGQQEGVPEPKGARHRGQHWQRQQRHEAGVGRAGGDHALPGVLALRGQEASRSGEHRLLCGAGLAPGRPIPSFALAPPPPPPVRWSTYLCHVWVTSSATDARITRTYGKRKRCRLGYSRRQQRWWSCFALVTATTHVVLTDSKNVCTREDTHFLSFFFF